MVAQSLSLNKKLKPKKEDKKSPFKWTSVSIKEIAEKDHRLEASVYGIEGRQARSDLEKCKWPLVNLCGDEGFSTAYHRPRFKRIYVEKSDFPIYQPAQINELYPKPSAYISGLTKTDINALRVKKGQVLLTCSGTIGNCTYVSNTLDNSIFSHDLRGVEKNNHPNPHPMTLPMDARIKSRIKKIKHGFTIEEENKCLI